MAEVNRAGEGRRRSLRDPQSFVAGLALIALALFAIWLISDLPQGTLRSMGPAMLPRWLAIGVGLCGVALVASGLLQVGPDLEAATLRGPVLVMLGVLAFAVTIRGFQIGPVTIPGLGLIIAGPLAMIIGGHATPEVRLREIAIMALALTAFCMMLFGDLLNLPIPLYPLWFSELFPDGWSNDTRLRVTAALLVLLAVVIYYAIPNRHGREPIDVVPNEPSGIV